MIINRSPNARCSTCGRRNTFLVRLTAGTFPWDAHKWTCLRPSHIRAAGKAAEKSSARKRAFCERWGVA